jgi:DNA-directed RNA polymerase specialized sigma24 family protein
MQASGCDERSFILARDGRYRRAFSPAIYLHLALPSFPFSPASPATSHLRTEVKLARRCRRAGHRIRPRSLRLVFEAKSHYLGRAPFCGDTRIMARRAMPHARCQYTGGIPMGSADRHTFLDAEGSPLEPRVQGVLRDLRGRFSKRLPRLDDDVFITEVFEEAGRRILTHESEHGTVDNLEAFAWTTVLNVARSRLARSSMRVVGSTLDPVASDAVLGRLHARSGSREQIEADILVQQILAQLSPEERDLYYWKAWGHSTREIARACGKSEGHVNTLVYRMRLKIRDLLGSMEPREPGSLRTQPRKPRTV